MTRPVRPWTFIQVETTVSVEVPEPGDPRHYAVPDPASTVPVPAPCAGFVRPPTGVDEARRLANVSTLEARKDGA